MDEIRLDGRVRVSLADAKALIVRALPVEGGADVYMHLLPDGTPDWDGPIEVKPNPHARRGEQFIDGDLPSLLNELSIEPRMIMRPIWKDFGSDKALGDYSITRDEFVRLAECYGIMVTVDEKQQSEDAGTLGEEAAQGRETKLERCQRLLHEFEQEQKRGARGALARVAKRDGRARQTVSDDINYAIKFRDETTTTKGWPGFPR